MRRFLEKPSVGLSSLFGLFRDGRSPERVDIRLPVALGAVVFGHFLGIHTNRGIQDRLHHSPGFRAFVGVEEPFCDETLRTLLDREVQLDDLRAALALVVRRALFRWAAGRHAEGLLGRRLVAQGVHGLTAKMIVALDGHEHFSSEVRSCSDCCHRTVKRKNPDGTFHAVPQHYHYSVVAYWLGGSPGLALDFEPVWPGENEQTAAYRLLERLHHTYGDLIGIVVADAGFDSEPFRHRVQQAGWFSVVRHKDPRRTLGGDAMKALDRRDPNRERPDLCFVDRDRVWQGWEQEETPGGRRLVWVRDPDDPQGGGACVTDLPASRANLAAIAIVMQARWELENTGFHELVGQWGFDHPAIHQDRANGAWVWAGLVLLAFNLWQLWVYRGLRLDPERPRRTHADLRFDLIEALGRYRPRRATDRTAEARGP